MLTRYDLLLGRMIEGLFELGGAEVHPVELDARLRAVALERRQESERGPVAPNRYRIELPFAIFEEMKALWPFVAEELELSLQEYGRSQGFGFLGRVRVDIAPGEAGGKTRIVGQFTDD